MKSTADRPVLARRHDSDRRSGSWHRVACAALCAATALLPVAQVAAQALPSAGTLYVPVSSENSVYVIDSVKRQVIQKITDVGEHPTVLRALPDHSKIYVDNFGPLLGEIAVIDGATNTVIKKISTNGVPLSSIQMSADGHYLYVPTSAAKLQVIDTRTDQIVHTFQLSSTPTGVDISPDGSTIYLPYIGGTVEARDSITGAVTHPAILVAGLAPGWSAVSLDGAKLYLLNALTNNVSVIDTAQWRLAKLIDSGILGGPSLGTITPDGSKIYVCNSDTRTIAVIDVATDTVVKTFSVSGVPFGVGFSPDGSLAYVSNLGPSSFLLPFPLGLPLLTLALFVTFPVLPSSIDVYQTSDYTLSGPSIQTGTTPIQGVYF